MATLTPPEAPEKKSEIDKGYEKGLDPYTRGRLGGVYAQRQEELDQRKQSMNGDKSLQDSEAAPEYLNPNDASLEDQEAQTAGHINNFTGGEQKRSKRDRAAGFFKGAKKKGPIAAILSIFVVGIVSFIMLSPGLLVIHMVETITDGMNMQSGSMDVRTAKMYASMMKSTSGFCSSKVSVRCKFRSMSDSQIKKLEDAGIKVIVNDSETITGRKKVDGLIFKKKTINASSLSMELKTNDEFRLASRSGYNPKFAGFADKIWAKVAATDELDLRKKSIFNSETKTDEERTARVKEVTKNGQSAGEVGEVYTKNKDGEYVDKEGHPAVDENGNALSEEAVLKANATAAETATELKTIIGDVDSNGEKLTPKVLAAANDAIEHPERHIDTGSVAKSLMGGVLQAPDNACTVYGLYNAVSFGAKTVRAVQMARYAMIFLNTASAMKAGQITPEDASYIGNLLTKTVNKTVKDAEGKVSTITTKAATDSYGYRYVAYGDSGPLTPSATEFLAGGGLGGKMTGFANGIIKWIPGTKKDINKTCKMIKNPFVQAGSAVLSVGLIFTGPVGWASLAGSLSLGVAAGFALEIARDILTPIITDMVAGVLVDDSTFGEGTGDAIVSGSGVIMSTLAGRGGNAPLRPEQAVAYIGGPQSEALALYKKEDRLSRSPFDPTSPNTFVGALVSKMIPYNNKMSSLTNIVTTSLAITSRSFKSLLSPSASAVENTVATYTQCDDEDYKRLGLATDPFCNPIRGVPSQYLEDDPVDIANRIMEPGNESVDEDGRPKTGTVNGERYSNFIKDCIDRESPLGYTGEDFNDNDGSKCFIENSEDDNGTITAQMKADWYVFNIDQRILDGIDNGYVTGTLNCGPFKSNSGGSVGGKITETQLKQQMNTYGLPEPKAESEGDAPGYNELLKTLKSDPDAGWAAQQLLNGEKKWKKSGGDIKEYLTTSWIWLETGPRPDPYEVNCNDAEQGTKVSDYCGGGLVQVAGFQGFDRKNDYVEVFKKLYSEDKLGSVLSDVIKNSDKTIDSWSYINPDQKAIISKYVNVDDLSSVTLADISPNKDIYDRKAQILTFILGKDPAMAAALNSFEVTEGDVVTMLQDCTKLEWSNTPYYCSKDLRLKVANIMMALYMFDGQGSADGGASSTDCADSGSGPKGGGVGIKAVWGGVGEKDLSYGFGTVPSPESGASPSWYDYGKIFGTAGNGHTGTDVPMEPYAPVYSPVEGIVVCEKNGVGPGGGGPSGPGCAGAADYSGDPIYPACLEGYDSTKPRGAGTIMIKITKNGSETGDILVLGHIAGSLVKVDQKVTPNQQVGTAGCMNGWHTHVEYYTPASLPSKLKLVDPVEFLG